MWRGQIDHMHGTLGAEQDVVCVQIGVTHTEIVKAAQATAGATE